MPSRSTNKLVKLPSVSLPSAVDEDRLERAAVAPRLVVEARGRWSCSAAGSRRRSTGSGRTATATGSAGGSGIGFDLDRHRPRSATAAGGASPAPCGRRSRPEARCARRGGRSGSRAPRPTAFSRSRCRSRIDDPAVRVEAHGFDQVESLGWSDATNLPLSRHSSHSSPATLSTTSPEPSPSRATCAPSRQFERPDQHVERRHRRPARSTPSTRCRRRAARARARASAASRRSSARR